MPNWLHNPKLTGFRANLSEGLGSVETSGFFEFPNLRNDPRIFIGSDYSGEHDKPEFQVLGFLVTNLASLEEDWEERRVSVREKLLPNNRRMSFKDLRDGCRIRAINPFLAAANHINGVLVCVGIDKSISFTSRWHKPDFKNAWRPDVLEKVLRICIFGAGLLEGLKVPNSDVFWITDSDAIVENPNAIHDTASIMARMLTASEGANPIVNIGIGAKFDDRLRAEDLLSLPDLAAGAYSETLTIWGKDNIPKELGMPNPSMEFSPQTKSMIINGWRSESHHPLKHMDLLVRQADDGHVILSYGKPRMRMLKPGETPPITKDLDEKWRRALEEWISKVPKPDP